MSTICAISTAPGVGGIAVIRVSGPDTFKICDRIFRPKKAGKSLSTQKAYTLTYGSIVGNNDETIDEVIATVFRAPHSFTGEDTVEIPCHRSTYIQQQILQSLISSGCRIAQPGEYTQRAFLNGKMDLSQAEAVADLIASSSFGPMQSSIKTTCLPKAFSNSETIWLSEFFISPLPSGRPK